jgi:hypothetical protein
MKWYMAFMVTVLLLVIGVGLQESPLLVAQQTPRDILQCFEHGEVVVSAPKVDSFLMKQNGMFVEARWMNPVTRETEVLVTTLPCLYHVTQPPADALGAN